MQCNYRILEEITTVPDPRLIFSHCKVPLLMCPTTLTIPVFASDAATCPSGNLSSYVYEFKNWHTNITIDYCYENIFNHAFVVNQDIMVISKIAESSQFTKKNI